MIELNGVKLLAHNKECQDYLEQYCRPEEFIDFDHAQWSHSLGHLPPPVYPNLPPIEVGKFIWPSIDASRFAVGYFLATDQDIVDLNYNDEVMTDSGPQPIELKIDTRSTEAEVPNESTKLTTNVYLLPPRPLARVQGSDSFWLLVVVDVRYFWWFKAANITASGSWQDLFTSIASALDETLTIDTISADYGNPSVRLTSYRQPLPQLLDAAARLVGCRVVRRYDGTVRIEKYSTSKQLQTDEINKIKTYGELLQGGVAADTASGRYIPLAGGRFDDYDIIRSVPNRVDVVFSKTVSGDYSVAPYILSSNTTAAGDPFGTVSGFSGVKVIVGDLTATCSGASATPSNLATLQSYTDRMAADWLHWQLGGIDQVFSGIVPWQPNGLVSTIEFTYNADWCCTRVMRERHNDRILGRTALSSRAGFASTYPEASGSGGSSSSGSSGGPIDCDEVCECLTTDQITKDLVTCVSPIFDDDGFMVGIKVDSTVGTFPECAVSFTEDECTVNPEDCCPDGPCLSAGCNVAHGTEFGNVSETLPCTLYLRVDTIDPGPSGWVFDGIGVLELTYYPTLDFDFGPTNGGIVELKDVWHTTFPSICDGLEYRVLFYTTANGGDLCINGQDGWAVELYPPLWDGDLGSDFMRWASGLVGTDSTFQAIPFLVTRTNEYGYTDFDWVCSGCTPGEPPQPCGLFTINVYE